MHAWAAGCMHGPTLDLPARSNQQEDPISVRIGCCMEWILASACMQVPASRISEFTQPHTTAAPLQQPSMARQVFNNPYLMHKIRLCNVHDELFTAVPEFCFRLKLRMVHKELVTRFGKWGGQDIDVSGRLLWPLSTVRQSWSYHHLFTPRYWEHRQEWLFSYARILSAYQK
jgi:hypothetical protein